MAIDPRTIERTYHDASKGIVGCAHYARKCMILAPCCNRYFGCRICHDEYYEGHDNEHCIDRKAIQFMICMMCDQMDRTPQPIAGRCARQADHVMAKYFCSMCNLFDDDETHEIFHCSKCSICRRGNKNDYFHCDKCGACYQQRLLGNHQCIENALADCPVCMMSMFESRQPAHIPRCGHALHAHCLQKLLVRFDPLCVICRKSLVNTNQPAEDILRANFLLQNPMPKEYADFEALITCNECNKRSVAAFHFAGHRCSHCHSWNTYFIERKQKEGAAEAGRIELLRVLHASEAIQNDTENKDSDDELFSDGELLESDESDGVTAEIEQTTLATNENQQLEAISDEND